MSGIDSYTKLMLHCNGTNGSTTITDSSASSHTPSVHGAAAISTTYTLLSGASLYLPGASGDYVDVPNHADFNFGNGDFTIDFWVREESNGGVYPAYIARDRASTWSPFLIGYGGSDIYMSSNGTSWDIASGKTLGAAVLNTPSHIEIGRQGNNFYAFRDGVLKDSWTSSLSFPAGVGALSIGSGQGGSCRLKGRIDELRISKGICRHTSNFTPETTEYTVTAPSYTPPPQVPASPTAFGVIVDSAVLTTADTPMPYIKLVDTTGSPCRNYLLEYYNVVSEREIPPTGLPDALLTCYLSYDGGTTFEYGPHYNNTGINSFAGETNSIYAAPFAFGCPQTLNMGCRLSIDTGDFEEYGVSGEANFKFNGGHTQYIATAVKGAVGGASNLIRPSGTKPTSMVGQAWFPSNGSQYFHWAIPFIFAGHFDGNVGQCPNAFQFKMDGGGTSGINIAAGTFILRRMD